MNTNNEQLEAAKGWYKIAKEQNNNVAIEILENMFPELKESEDEKLRKEMLQIAEESEDSFYMVMTPDKRKHLIAWLEKQDNLMKALQISNLRIAELVEEKYNLEEKLKTQGEQNPAWSEEDELCLENAIMYCEWARAKAPDFHCYKTSEKSID